MKQITLSASNFDHYRKTTRRAAFWVEMDRGMPWAILCTLIEPFTPKRETDVRPWDLSACRAIRHEFVITKLDE